MPGKQKIIELTIEKESSRLLNYIRKHLPLADAEDVLQDVFAQLFVGYSQIRSINNISGWLFKTAMNKIIDMKRKKKPEFLLDKDIMSNHKEEGGLLKMEDILPSLTNSPEDEFMKNVIWQEVDDTLDELPEEQKEVFVLHEFEGRSFKEISGITGESINTLLSRKRYAIVHLRKNLEKLYDQLKTG